MTPLIGLVFDKDRLTGKDSYQQIISPEEQRLRLLKGCIAPFAVTNILCMIFCVVSMVENLNLQVKKQLYLCTHTTLGRLSKPF